jgi:hypothetical protein
MEAKLLKYQMAIIEKELLYLLKEEALPIVNKLLTDCVTFDSRAFYWKMKADYSRYLTELPAPPGKERRKQLEEVKRYYERAVNECDNLLSTHPLRLATALNQAVFLAENMQLLTLAIDIAKSAFEAALYDLQTLNESEQGETLRAMQLLRDNYTLWEIDNKAIIEKKKAAGHLIEGAQDDENIHDLRPINLEHVDDPEDLDPAKV